MCICLCVSSLGVADCECVSVQACVYMRKRFSESQSALCMHFGVEEIMPSASANEVVSSETAYFLSLTDKEISLTVLLFICLSFHVFLFTSHTRFILYAHQTGQSLRGRIIVFLIGSVSLGVVVLRTQCELTWYADGASEGLQGSYVDICLKYFLSRPWSGLKCIIILTWSIQRPLQICCNQSCTDCTGQQFRGLHCKLNWVESWRDSRTSWTSICSTSPISFLGIWVQFVWCYSVLKW